MRALNLGCVFVLILTVSCHSTGRRTSTSVTTQEGTKQDALARCGISPGLNGAIAVGTDNQFLTAIARQTIKIKADVEIKTDARGKKLTLMAKDNSLDMTCRCPSGCAESGDG